MRALLLSCLLAGCTMNPAVDPLLPTVPASATQVLLVRPLAPGSIQAQLSAYERGAGGWTLALGPLPAVVGRTGVIAGEQKREGDGHTPAGIYALRTAFGYAPTLATGLQYRQATGDDYWVDEASSPNYNQWVKGKPAVSAERMRRDDELYSVGAVIEYNTTPVVAGRGSAIFFHVWSGPDLPTAGCVAVAAEHARRVLGWLDRKRCPVMVIVAP
jgi:L,D-peptidoglycan transpeptidase YkuD (ErfK/YbiS/YcfS/YnhG family)